MPDELTCECPHCHAPASIAAELIGKVVDCPECGQPFQLKAPVAKPVDSAPGRNTGAGVVERETDHERIIREVHPVVFRNHLILTLISLLLMFSGIGLLIVGLTGRTALGLEGVPLLVSGGALLAAVAVYFLYRAVQAMSTTLKVTSARTIAIRGILSKSTNEVQHDDVRNIRSERNLLERVLNYGDIALSSSGQDDMEIIVHDIPDPEGIVRIIRSHQ